MSKTEEDDSLDNLCILGSSPGQSQSAPTNPSANMKEAKKEANRIAQVKCRRNRHWIQEINKLNGKKRFAPESIRWCVEPVTLAKKLNKRDIQWEEGVQLSQPGTVKFYANSSKPMERAVIV